jgi:hypothetical protein
VHYEPAFGYISFFRRGVTPRVVDRRMFRKSGGGGTCTRVSRFRELF